jgi:hypothetical protein
MINKHGTQQGWQIQSPFTFTMLVVKAVEVLWVAKRTKSEFEATEGNASVTNQEISASGWCGRSGRGLECPIRQVCDDKLAGGYHNLHTIDTTMRTAQKLRRREQRR